MNILIVGSIVLLILLGIVLYNWFLPDFLVKFNFLNNKKTTAPEAGNKPQESGAKTPSPAPAKKSVPKTSAPVPEKAIPYTEAVNLYADKRIQFDANCLLSPNYIAFKIGTKIMLDNRSSQTRPVFLDGKRYDLEPYGFKIITLATTASLPHTIMIDCGSGKNNGRIILQQ